MSCAEPDLQSTFPSLVKALNHLSFGAPSLSLPQENREAYRDISARFSELFCRLCVPQWCRAPTLQITGECTHYGDRSSLSVPLCLSVSLSLLGVLALSWTLRGVQRCCAAVCRRRRASCGRARRQATRRARTTSLLNHAQEFLAQCCGRTQA